ncbi:hypothetical protein [Aidingimonas halophila]|uniref:Uncharacterized protein n=1 Tax=Aidingimonas halophila TaxID=574349 RepID=A0A1H3ATQ5_9GAMM|nr:hypothetical protein [Aidingimonas halophila]GHC25348.1 hypothetical protein GCM10008094_15460 [Aidingimonas halophila]SDX33057.1 hypothetical protein SAMN05443545_10528 [Aidingimonas halophila]
MRRFVWMLVAASLMSALIAIISEPMKVEARVIRLQMQEQLPEAAEHLRHEPLGVQAALVDYAVSGDDVLVLKARAALQQYPGLARDILAMYGTYPVFRDVLRRYGAVVVIPIHYFMQHELPTLKVRHAADEAVDSLSRWWHQKDDDAGGVNEELNSRRRGEYALAFIDAGGHDFLGQFRIDDDGNIAWIQSERWLETINAFFAGGIRELETQYRLGEDVSAVDLAWASVDVAIMASAVKLVRAGQSGIVGGRSASLSTRGSLYTSRVGNAIRFGLQGTRYAKWPVVVGMGYMAVRHPGLINDLLAGAARVLGWPSWLVQWLGWTLILLPLLSLSRWLVKPFLRPVRWSARTIMIRD